jgi:glycosyltransferase involved in cell wall biosynthesis
MMTTESVSVILSVENAQNWLANDIEALIDCLADLTARFEIIVVDNASRDYTVEILDEMRSRFPQVRFRRFAERRMLDELIDSGLEMASGEFVFTTSPGARIEPNEMRRLWALRGDPRLLVARSRPTARRVDAGLINRLTHWAQRVTAQSEPVTAENFGGLQMMRRRAVDQLQPALSKPHGAASSSSSNAAHIEISHVSHQQLASPKLVETRRRVHSEVERI